MPFPTLETDEKIGEGRRRAVPRFPKDKLYEIPAVTSYLPPYNVNP